MSTLKAISVAKLKALISWAKSAVPPVGVESACPELHIQVLEDRGMDAGGQVKTPGIFHR